MNAKKAKKLRQLVRAKIVQARIESGAIAPAERDYVDLAKVRGRTAGVSQLGPSRILLMPNTERGIYHSLKKHFS